MSTTIKATGHFIDSTPTLTVSSGRGNSDRPEIHLSVRDDSGESAKTVFLWVDRDALLAAIHEADARVRRAIEIGEPA